MRQLLDLKGPAKLSDEVQWSIRMLLPKPGLTGSASGSQQAAVAHGAGDGTGINNALAVLAEHAQQVRHCLESPSAHFSVCMEHCMHMQCVVSLELDVNLAGEIARGFTQRVH